MGKLTYQCCFCGESIEDGVGSSKPIDPCAVILIANWQEPELKQVEQQFFCHVACFKGHMWTNVPVEIEELVESQNREAQGNFEL